uniref:Uncharacterized protein n=1 Tax=Arundo donax TaxID=35708 RepID=A0A0A9BY27_ARUDO
MKRQMICTNQISRLNRRGPHVLLYATLLPVTNGNNQIHQIITCYWIKHFFPLLSLSIVRSNRE